MQEKFEIDLTLDHIKNVVDSQMNKAYREFRYQLHKYFIDHGGETNKNLAKQSKPNHVLQSDWEYLCDYFDSDVFKVIE